MDDKVKNLATALCEVRKAHRLVYSYQERMLSLVKFIRNKLDFNDFVGVKHFSNTVYQYKGNIKLRLFDGIWAWDSLYSYVFEYYIGSIELNNNSEILLSIIQYTDTGYFDSNSEDQKDINTYVAPEDSVSKLLFFMEYKPAKCKLIWEDYNYTKQFVLNKEYACKEHKETVLYPKGEGKNKILMYSIPIERFVDEINATKALNEYLNFLKRNNIELEIV